ncbi:MAG TPA: hypothetical protein VJH97_03925 [Candidatus Nanoarchaeia archaeon]|nr:hypothetical protein [Candidatus Nanoarchaeia archaeon]
MTEAALDLNEIRDMNGVTETPSKFQEAFLAIKEKTEKQFGVKLHDGMRRISRDMYHSVTPKTPFMLQFIVAEIIDALGQNNEKLSIKNPLGVYNLCAGIGRSYTLGKGWTLGRVVTEGDVGSFYGSHSADVDMVHHVHGCAGRSFMNNALQGMGIVDGVADEGAGQVNHGASILIKGKAGARLGWGQRAGNIVTLKNIPLNAGLFMAGGSIITLGDEVDEELGPDMQEGTIYVPYAHDHICGKGAACKKIEEIDYARIKDALKPFEQELNIIGLTEFNQNTTFLTVDGKALDFSKFYKILPERFKI